MTTMKKNIAYCFITSLIFILPACQSPESRAVNQNNSQDTSFQDDGAGSGSKELNNSVEPGGTAPKDNNISQKTKVSDDDKLFLDGVKTAGALEISMAKLAQQSSNPKIKSFAEMMLKDHTQMDKEVEALATQSQIVLRTNFDNEQLKEIEMMKGLKGTAFDQHYKDMMVKGHAKTVALLKSGADTREEKVKEFAEKSLPVIESHYQAAQKL
jgi:putative membrane protein